MALENRDVRPFKDLHKVQSWLQENVELIVRPRDGNGDALEVEPNGTLRLDPNSIVTSDLRLSIGDQVTIGSMLESADAFARELGAKDSSLFSVVIYTSTHYLKFTDELRRLSLGDLEELRGGLSLTPSEVSRPRGLSLPHNGFQIELAVILNSHLRQRPGLPFRLGTWLARIKFRIASPTEGLGFSPIPLTDELRADLRLDKQTATFARVNPAQPDIRDATNLDDFVEYYVDEQLLNRMSANPRHPQSALVQTEIFLGAVNFLLMSLRGADWLDELTLAEVDEGLIGKLLRIVATESTGELARAFAILKSEPSVFAARVQDQCDYRRRLEDSLAVVDAGR